MDDLRRLGPAVLGPIAALATLAAVSWRAAEEHRGLDLADLRSVVLVALLVLAAALLLSGPREQP